MQKNTNSMSQPLESAARRLSNVARECAELEDMLGAVLPWLEEGDKPALVARLDAAIAACDSTSSEAARIRGSLQQSRDSLAPRQSTLDLFVKDMIGGTYQIQVGPATTLADVQQQLAELANVAADKQRLMYAGKRINAANFAEVVKEAHRGGPIVLVRES